MLFVSAKVSQYALLPQGKIEAADRVLNMVAQMDAEGFGNCTIQVLVKSSVQRNISRKHARMNRENIYLLV
jgi:succinate dehydrogenase / fumarate reductase iron-sulfur subunit